MKTLHVNGADIPVIGLGTWTLRGDACVDLVRHGIDIGYRHIDTAASYENEAEIGEAIRNSRVERSEVFVTTKVWWTNLSASDLLRSAESSLQRLRLDYVDLLLVHWPNPEFPLHETMDALSRLRERGLTRHIGVANFPTSLLAEAVRVSPVPLVANQVESHPYLDQRKIHEACRMYGMAMVAYCPLHRGGSLLEEEPIRAAAVRHGKTPGQIVLRWHIQQENVAAIPRTSRKERLAENIDVFDFMLDDDEMEVIGSLRSEGRRICDYDFSPQWDEP
ncbi:aldo/keto reductase [Chelativorans sp. Marseille-P2723]|uniref:aldo/keto reductase n=1 Tax=Chelativorans sp. Marseille-P2723 TaxID=2709133 RepID=UPI00156F40C2|nr:aldo/keto reductase [Chelativorans sp. Marseille-P2723]